MSKLTKGFTLTEILVVTSIIGILAAIASSSLSDARARARFTQVETTMDQTAKAAQMYRYANEFWPSDARPNYSIPSFVGNYISGSDLPPAPCSGYVYDWQNWPDYRDWGEFDYNRPKGEKFVKLDLVDTSGIPVLTKCIYIEPNWKCNEITPGGGNTPPGSELSEYCCHTPADCTAKMIPPSPPSDCVDISTVADKRLFCN